MQEVLESVTPQRGAGQKQEKAENVKLKGNLNRNAKEEGNISQTFMQVRLLYTSMCVLVCIYIYIERFVGNEFFHLINVYIGNHLHRLWKRNTEK